MTDEDLLRGLSRARVERWLAAVERVAPATFVRVESSADLPDEVRADSHYWCDEVFTPEANPHDAPGARLAVHRATPTSPDLVRHAYTAAGLALTVTEGRNFLLVEIDPRSVDVLAIAPNEQRAAIHRVATRVFRASAGRAPSFSLPPAIEEGARFCSNDRAEPLLLARWHDRIEGGVRKGRLFFLCYKKVSQRVGFAGDERWFPESRRRRA